MTKYWFDLTNSPHVMFFKPIIEKLRDNNEIIITSRDHAQTIGLLNDFGIKHTRIGNHAGKSKILKAFGFISRTWVLSQLMRKNKPDKIVVHQSPYGIVAGALAGVKERVYIFDNETAKLQNLISFIFATKIISPEVVKRKRAFGKRIEKYNGVKECVYLSNFKPDKSVLKKLGLNYQDKFIIIRPEPFSAAYYKGKKNVLSEFIEEATEKKRYKIVILPRNNEQRNYYKNKFGNRVILTKPGQVVDAPSLIYYSSFMIGAGGTMNREGCILGTNVISTYQGDILDVDKWLIKKGYMIHTTNLKIEDLDRIPKKLSLHKSFHSLINMLT